MTSEAIENLDGIGEFHDVAIVGQDVMDPRWPLRLVFETVFVAAASDVPREATLTVQTRGGTRYLLALDIDRNTSGQKPPAPATDLARAADRLLTGTPDDRDHATAELLRHIAATYNRQDDQLRHLARALPR
ncbi:hypothetical protein [Streptomyces avermitilis]|uniref:hypothetical protein n=1 Tax=Streptomyces avermitilis TaxID=33903 RepID=UPI0033B73C18